MSENQWNATFQDCTWKQSAKCRSEIVKSWTSAQSESNCNKIHGLDCISILPLPEWTTPYSKALKSWLTVSDLWESICIIHINSQFTRTFHKCTMFNHQSYVFRIPQSWNKGHLESPLDIWKNVLQFLLISAHNQIQSNSMKRVSRGNYYKVKWLDQSKINSNT